MSEGKLRIACPECLATVDEAEFYENKVVLAREPISPYVYGRAIRLLYNASDWKLDYGRSAPAKACWQHVGRYFCGNCENDFDNFEVLTEEELKWRRMMGR